MVEWSKAHAWKACDAVTYPGVRIPPSPPEEPSTDNSSVESSLLVSRTGVVLISVVCLTVRAILLDGVRRSAGFVNRAG